MDRRTFLQGAAVTAAAGVMPPSHAAISMVADQASLESGAGLVDG